MSEEGESTERQLRERKEEVDEGVRRERAWQLRKQRSGHLGDVRKKFIRVKELFNKDIDFETLKKEVEAYEHAFHKFEDVHEQCYEDDETGYEDDETIKCLMIESYESQKDFKYEIELLHKKTIENLDGSPSSQHISKSTGATKYSRTSSQRSIKSRIQVEEANLKIKELNKRQQIQREFKKAEEEYNRRVRECERQLEVLQAETELEKAVALLRLKEVGILMPEENSVISQPSFGKLPNEVQYEFPSSRYPVSSGNFPAPGFLFTSHNPWTQTRGHIPPPRFPPVTLDKIHRVPSHVYGYQCKYPKYY